MLRLLFDRSVDGGIGEAEARDILAPIESSLQLCWFYAWEQWITEVSESARGKLSRRSRACNLNDFAVEAAKLEFADHPLVEPDFKLGFFKLYVGSSLVLRFKRLDRSKLARNIRTRQQRDYYLNKPIKGLRNECKRLTIGYILDELETGIDDILVTFQIGQKVLVWDYPIVSEASFGRTTESTSADSAPNPKTTITIVGKPRKEKA